MAYWVSTITYGSISGQETASPSRSAFKRRRFGSEGIIKSRKCEYEELWGERLSEYLEFQKKHGRAPKRTLQYENEFRLAEWLANQIQINKHGLLLPERRKLLEENGLLKEYMNNEQLWNANLSTYLDFQKKHGHPPKRIPHDAAEFRLAQWLINQRALSQQGKLSPVRKAVLEECRLLMVGIGKEQAWDGHLVAYLEFQKKHGRTPSTYAADASEKSLASWGSNQRSLFRAGKISDERKGMLSSAGIAFKMKRGRRKEKPSMPKATLSHAQKWEKNLAGFLSFFQAHGRAPSKQSGDECERFLSLWGMTQRGLFRKGKMPADRVDILNAASFFDLQTNQQAWGRHLADVCAFAEQHQRLPSSSVDVVEEKKLGLWWQAQIGIYKKGKLSETRLAKLAASPPFRLQNTEGIILGERWTEHFEAWASFRKEHGREPSQVAKGAYEKKLGSWCSTQRIQFNHGELSSARPMKLKDAGFDFGEGGMWNKKWNDEFAKYVEFQKKTGGVPSVLSDDLSGVRLARWRLTQRALNRAGKLLPERKELLEISGIL